MKFATKALEFNFDGLVGPTHNYAGLAFGNIASQSNAGSVSSPKQAALQGLAKMRLLMSLGIPQAVLPPQQRPNIDLLKDLGFTGSVEQILQSAYKYQPQLLAVCYSAASMWVANAATISPSCNTVDKKLHITPANLIYNAHRAQEAAFNYKLFNKIFADPKHFVVHHPLLAYRDLGDEGAANHSVLSKDYGQKGLELFVYGKNALDDSALQPGLFPARQTKLASSSLARLHGLQDNNVVLLQQNPLAIDAGVFHNDVIFVANKNVVFYHALAFVDEQPFLQAVKKFFGDDYHLIKVQSHDLTLEEIVKTYVFNSQLVSLPDSDNMSLILPTECERSQPVYSYLQGLLKENTPIKSLHYVECRESMRNGGGPACLRLRVTLTPDEQRSIHQSVILTEDLYSRLTTWVNKHYRDTLTKDDLLDPKFVEQSYMALDELTKILHLGNIYPFQQ